MIQGSDHARINALHQPGAKESKKKKIFRIIESYKKHIKDHRIVRTGPEHATTAHSEAF